MVSLWGAIQGIGTFFGTLFSVIVCGGMVEKIINTWLSGTTQMIGWVFWIGLQIAGYAIIPMYLIFKD